VKRQAIQLTQRDAFGDIGLKKREGFEEVVRETESLATIEQEYS
jgi:hypothetical protein